MLRLLIPVLLLLGSAAPPALAQQSVWQAPHSLLPPPAVTPPVPPRVALGERFESAIAGAGYGAVVGGVAFGLADYLAGPFWNTPVHGFSVALTSLAGAVFVGAPAGAVIGALRSR